MAWTTPRTFVAGELETASIFNTHLRDNLAWMATDSPACRVYKSTTQTTTTGNAANFTFNSERFDNAAVHSTSSNTDRFTIPSGAGGKYLMGANTGIPSNVSGGNDRQFYWYLNNATVLARCNMHHTTPCAASLVTTYALAASDYVTVQAYQDSGGTRTWEGEPGPGPEAYIFWFRT